MFRFYVKLLASAAGLLCALALAVAAPATARPVDFELAPAGQARAASAGGSLVSKPLTTPRRFNLVGMRWRGRAQADIEVRVRSAGRWSRWAHLGSHASGTSDPIWVGRAGAVQYRLSRPLPGLKLHFVDLGRRALSSARPAAKRARGAAAPPFPYVSRAAWGASACPPRTGPTYGEVRAVHVHHTVSLNDYTPEEGPAIVLAVCRFHRNSNGWSDIGYNMLVDKYGVLYEGRAGGLDKAVIGAQAQGFNAQTAGISNIGDFTALPQTPEALSAMATYIRWKLPVHGQPLSGLVTLTSAGGSATKYPAGARVTLERVIGHRDTGRTACPGEALYAQLDELRTLVETGQPLSTLPTASVSATIADSNIAYGELLPVGGTLISPTGLPVPGEVVDVQVNNQGRWRTVKRVTTDASGAFATELKPRKRSYLRVRWPGNASLHGASSARVLVHVSPLVSIDAPLLIGKKGETLAVSGTVAPRKRFVHLVLQQRIDGRYRRVGIRRVRVVQGRFSASFVPGFVARYRYFVVVKPDLNTDRAVSQVVDLKATR